MIEIFYRYHVHPSQVRAFEQAYGPRGPWAKLFEHQPGFKRTRLFRHRKQQDVYVTVDIWESKSDYDAFRKRYAADYHRLDGQLSMLKLDEQLLGYYEGTLEYQGPLDLPH